MSENKTPDNIETVLVLPGGDAFGAFTAGVYKELVNNNIKIDIVAGTGVGAINASIIAANSDDHPEIALENFWIELAENISNQNSKFEECLKRQPSFLDEKSTNNDLTTFIPSFEYLSLERILEKYFNSEKLRGQKNSRLILTGIDISNFNPLNFDSNYDVMSLNQILAVSGYNLGDFPGVKINDKYVRDASLLSTSPLTTVMYASPVNDKRVFMVGGSKPTTMTAHNNELNEKNISSYDTTNSEIRMLKLTMQHLILLESMYNILVKTKLDKQSNEKLTQIKPAYHKLVEERGAIVKEIIRIERNKESYNDLKKDFSTETVKNLITAGQSLTNQILKM